MSYLIILPVTFLFNPYPSALILYPTFCTSLHMSKLSQSRFSHLVNNRCHSHLLQESSFLILFLLICSHIHLNIFISVICIFWTCKLLTGPKYDSVKEMNRNSYYKLIKCLIVKTILWPIGKILKIVLSKYLKLGVDYFYSNISNPNTPKYYFRLLGWDIIIVNMYDYYISICR